MYYSMTQSNLILTPFRWGKGPGKPETTIKLPYGGPETTVGSLCHVKMVPAPPDSQQARLLEGLSSCSVVYDPCVG